MSEAPYGSSFSIHDRAALEAWRKAFRVDPHQIRKLLHAFYREVQPPEQCLRHLESRSARESFQTVCRWSELSVVRRHDSEVDHSTKLVFETRQGRMETVLMRSARRTSICISSQVGCAAGCVFCATGSMGLTRNLTAAEMLSQVVEANRLLVPESRRIRNVVFMGMGEPFHNSRELTETIEILRAPHGLHLAERRIVVSTVGVPDEMLRFANRFPQISLALSLHGSNQETREKLIPTARRAPINTLRDAIQQISERGTPLMIEYIMLKGITDGVEDARQLVDFLAGVNAHINLIPYNKIDTFPGGEPSPRETRDAFATILRDAGFPTTIRYSMGDDIGAACGQLVQARP